MTDVDRAELVGLLDEVRRELGETVDELDRSRAAHRRVESLLLLVLDHVPVPIIVVDAELRVRAASRAAEAAWDATVDAHLSGVDDLDERGVVEACRLAFEHGHVASATIPDGVGMALVEEPGTGVRYVAAWAG